jgi:hypothetical protein
LNNFKTTSPHNRIVAQASSVDKNTGSGRESALTQTASLDKNLAHHRDSVEIQKELFDAKKSKLAKYKELILGESSTWFLLKYEFITSFVSWLPGAFGLLLRSKL